MPNNVERLYSHFSEDLAAAAHAFYLWKSINNCAADDRAIYQGINEQALSWNTIAHSLQTTFFIALGRLFDTDGGAFSVHAFLRGCMENIDEFGKDALRARKIAALNGEEPDWLTGYMNGVHIPTKKDFGVLRGELSKHGALYEDIYRPLRNQVFAHKDAGSMDSVQSLFGKTKISDIENLLWFLYQVKEVVFQLLYNGELRKIGDFKINEETVVLEDVRELLLRLRVESPAGSVN